MGCVNNDDNFFFIKFFSRKISFVGKYLPKTDFFTCGKMPIWANSEQKSRFFRIHIAYMSNILDSGQITYLAPSLTYRSLISIKSADLQKNEKM